MRQNHVELTPSPASLIESLRDVGYSMETALADVVDNSITAQAENIDIRYAWNAGRPWLAVIDDGAGMSAEELTEAMRFGSMNPLEERHTDDLGRFGLGMKTASFSQCRHLTVFSMKNGVASCCEWDLEQISKADDHRWLLNVLSESDIESRAPLGSLVRQYFSDRECGTVVLWEGIDRMDAGISLEKQSQFLNGLVSDAREHLELVFHRFLSPEPGRKAVKMCHNGDALVGLDPFNSKSGATTELPKETIPGKDGSKIVVQPYVLPHHNKIPNEEYLKYAGAEGYLHNQGFYVYRNRRLIIKGTWFRLIKKAELTKLVRVQVDIPNSLDKLWKIDVKKSSATPPESVRHELKRIIERIELSGKRAYEGESEYLHGPIKTPAWSRKVADERVFYEINRDHPLLRSLSNSLSRDQQEQLNLAVRTIESSFPSDLFFCDFAGAPEKLQQPGVDEEYLARILDYVIAFWGMNDGVSEEQEAELLRADPFSSNKELTLRLLKQKGVR